MLEKSNLQTFIKKKHFIGQTGFTLIELLATLAILGVVTGIAAPAVGNIREKAKQEVYDRSVDMVEIASTIANSDGLAYTVELGGQYAVQDLISEGYVDDVEHETILSGFTRRRGPESNVWDFIKSDITNVTEEVVTAFTDYDIIYDNTIMSGYDEIIQEPVDRIIEQEWSMILENDREVDRMLLNERVIQEGRNGQRVIGTRTAWHDWADDIIAESPEYVVAQDSDFTWNATPYAPNAYDHDDNDTTPEVNGYFQYTGSYTHVIVPETVNGNVLKDAYSMFIHSPVEGVAMNNESVTDMSKTFYGSRSTSLDLSSFDTSNVTVMSEMFWSSKATSLDLSSFDTSNVTNMFGMFYDSQATSLDVSSFDTSNVTNMKGMFYISKATSLDVSRFDTSNVTNMEAMFLGSQATSLNLSSFDTSNVTKMTQMFYGSKATSLDLSSFDTSKVTDMNNMFYDSQATTLNLSSFDTSNVTNMNNMFASSKATSLDLSSFDTSKVTTMKEMFWDSRATSINLSSFDTSNVDSMDGMFRASQATSLDLSSFDTSNVRFMTNMFWDSQATILDLSSFDTSKVTIMSRMSGMFRDSKATTAYARTEVDAEKFNSSTNKPSGLTFMVKP